MKNISEKKHNLKNIMAISKLNKINFNMEKSKTFKSINQTN